MELVAVQMNKEMVIPEEKVMTEVTEISSGNFIEANTETVVLNHLKNDTIIPVFAKDNETILLIECKSVFYIILGSQIPFFIFRRVSSSTAD